MTCEARLNVFSPLGDSAVEACRVLRSDNIVISCEVVSTSFFWHLDNFILEDHGEILKGQWVSDITGNVLFTTPESPSLVGCCSRWLEIVSSIEA